MKLYTLDVTFPYMDEERTIHPVVLRVGTQTILVDCGYAGFMPLLAGALAPHGLQLSDLTGVLITHHDIDHMGCLAELKAAYPALKVYASPIEKPWIDGSDKPLRLQQAEALFDCLAEEQKPWALDFQQRLKSVQPVAVDEVLPLDGPLSFLPGLQAVHTPGHTPGHLSLWIEERKTLVAADAVVIEGGELNLANPQFTIDLPKAIESVRKIRQLAPQILVCFHGGVLEHGVPAALDALVERYTAR